MVVVKVKTMTGRPFELQVEPGTEVATLRSRIASQTRLPVDRLKLVHKGTALLDEQKAPSLADMDTILAVAAARPPPKHVKDAILGDGHDEDEGDLHFRLPPGAPPWQHSLVRYLRRQVHVPDVFLIILFGIRARVWAGLAAWLLACPLAARLEVGPLYVLLSVIALIYFNLGTRQPGQASAYSVFNNFRELPGQLNADAFDQQLRRGQLM